MQSEHEVSPRMHAAWWFILVSLGLALLQPAIPIAPIVLLAPVALVVFVQMAMSARTRERQQVVVLSLLMVLQLGFWIAFARVAELALTVSRVGSESRLDLMIFTPLLLLAPLAAKFWSMLDDHGFEPSPTAKFSLGYLSLAAGCTCLGSSLTSPLAVSLGSIAAGVAALTFAALCVGPTCFEVIRELAPRGQRGTAVGCWVLAYVFAHSLGGWMHSRPLSSSASFDVCLALGFGAVATAVLSSFMWHGLHTLTSPATVGSTVHSLGADSLGADSLGSDSVGSLGTVGSVGSGSLG